MPIAISRSTPAARARSSDGFAVGIELIVIEMAVRVDELHPLFQARAGLDLFVEAH